MLLRLLWCGVSRPTLSSASLQQLETWLFKVSGAGVFPPGVRFVFLKYASVASLSKLVAGGRGFRTTWDPNRSCLFTFFFFGVLKLETWRNHLVTQKSVPDRCPPIWISKSTTHTDCLSVFSVLKPGCWCFDQKKPPDVRGVPKKSPDVLKGKKIEDATFGDEKNVTVVSCWRRICDSRIVLKTCRKEKLPTNWSEWVVDFEIRWWTLYLVKTIYNACGLACILGLSSPNNQDFLT